MSGIAASLLFVRNKLDDIIYIMNAIIVGASSGMGYEVARILLRDGWTLGLAARRTEPFGALASEFPGKVHAKRIDVMEADAPQVLQELLAEMGGMDLYFHAAGVGWQNLGLECKREMDTVATNGMGFASLVGVAYRYFAGKGHGHIAVISSIAGTKGLGVAPAYSATKAFQNVYIQALEQQAAMRHLKIRFTDIRPGFVRTPLLDDGTSYPMLMDHKKVAHAIVDSLYSHRHVRVIDWRYRILTFFWRLLPNWLWRRLSVHN